MRRFIPQFTLRRWLVLVLLTAAYLRAWRSTLEHAESLRRHPSFGSFLVESAAVHSPFPFILSAEGIDLHLILQRDDFPDWERRYYLWLGQTHWELCRTSLEVTTPKAFERSPVMAAPKVRLYNGEDLDTPQLRLD